MKTYFQVASGVVGEGNTEWVIVVKYSDRTRYWDYGSTGEGRSVFIRLFMI